MIRLEAELPGKLDLLPPATRQRVLEAIRNAAFGIERRIKESMTEPKSGRVYQFLRNTKRTRAGKRANQDYIRYTASAPGEAPATRPGIVNGGALSRSVQTVIDERNLVGTVTIGMRYSRHLEYGTDRMLPRPFAKPAAEAVLPEFETGLIAIFGG